jgi:hypothetical protein
VAEVIFMRPAAVHDSPGGPAFEQVYRSSYSTLVGASSGHEPRDQPLAQAFTPG